MKRTLSQFDYMLNSYDSNDEYVNELRESFVDRFNRKAIKSMTLKEYAIGAGSHDSFCYSLERELRGLGSFLGGNAFKFGIYYSQPNRKYVTAKKWDQGTDQATLTTIKTTILHLLDDGAKKKFPKIESNPLALTFKLKLLSVYYPKQYLNIFATNHLNYFLYQFYGDDYDYSKLALVKQQDLIALKKANPATKGWNNIKFGNYLYHLFPDAPEEAKKAKEEAKKAKYQQVVPKHPKKRTVPEKASASTKEMTKVRGKGRRKLATGVGKIDYVEHEKKLKNIGDLGEEIVVASEKSRLSEYPELAKKVKRVSLESDKYGYDVLSFETDGSPRCIEVKATTDKYQKQFSFFLTENERQHAMTLKNYWLYRVFEVHGTPQIIRIANPFKYPQQVRLVPTQYQATIRLK